VVVRDLGVTGWHSDLSKGESARGGGPPMGAKEAGKTAGAAALEDPGAKCNSYRGTHFGQRVGRGLQNRSELRQSAAPPIFSGLTAETRRRSGQPSTITGFAAPTVRAAAARSPLHVRASSPSRTEFGSSC
jgi:hypothetical protein